ncbi:MAG: hypothetical protein WBX25_34170, partial [Rhodomicrobium sp.]
SRHCRPQRLGAKKMVETAGMAHTGALHKRYQALILNGECGSNPVIGLFSGNARYWVMTRSSCPPRGTLAAHLGI